MSLLPNTVINGNCLEVMKEIDDASIDMILCDLPYGATQNSWDSVIPPAPLWEQYERIIKPNGAILLFGQDKFTATMMLSNPMCKVYERPPLVLSEGMKLFAVNAGYRKTDVGTNWYYVRAKNAREARKRFKDRITWLDVYGVREVTDAALIQDVLSSPRKYICF